MLVATVYLILGLVYGWVAVQNGPARFRRLMDETGRKRYGGALNWFPCLCFSVVGLVKILRHM